MLAGFIFDLLFGVVIEGTGSVILSLFSMDDGVDDDSNEAKSKLAILSGLSFWVGAAFWIAVFGLLWVLMR